MEDGQRPTTALFLWNVPPAVRARIEDGVRSEHARLRLVFPVDLDESTLARHAESADVLLGWRPSDAVLDAATHARWLVNPGAGVQHIVGRLREKNAHRETPLSLANGHGNAYATAQGGLALLLALTNRLVEHHRWMAEGAWRTGDKDGPSVLLRDRTVGLLGYGAVNRHLHRFIVPLGPRVLALRRRWNGSEGLPPVEDRYVESNLDQFLDAIDTLVIALPLTGSTEGLIGEEALDRLGPSGLLVNIGRGPIVDEPALYRALSEKRIAGASIDVWYDYAPRADSDGSRYPYAAAHPFHELPNVILSPHRAASPFSDITRWDDVAATLVSIARGEAPRNAVDLDAGY